MYRAVKLVSWIFAGLVAIFLVAMFCEYFGEGQGAASPFGKLTGLAVLFNTFVWAVPTALWLRLVYTNRFENYFISKNGS